MLTGFDIQPIPPRRGRQLKDSIAALFTLYSFYEVMTEIAQAKPLFDINIVSAKEKPKVEQP